MESTKDPGQHQSGFIVSQIDSLICLWLLFLGSSIAMILRLISQFGILRIFRADDMLMITAWIFQALLTTTSTLAIYWGLGRHTWQLSSKDDFGHIMKFQMLSMIFGTLCGMFGRIAFAVFLLYFIQRVSRPQTYIIWAIIVVQVVVNILLLALTLARCAPSVDGPWYTGLCLTSESVMTVQYVLGAFNAASNICLTILAVGLVLQTRASLHARVSLGILLSLSLIATVAEIVNLVKVRQTSRDGSDFTYLLNIWDYWYAIEMAVIIITVSLPKIRPLVLNIHQRLKTTRFWAKSASICRFNCSSRKNNESMTRNRLSSLQGRHILLADDHKESLILPQLSPKSRNTSIYSKDLKHITSHSGHQSHHAKHHCRHLRTTSGNTNFSLGSRSTTATTLSGEDTIDLGSLDPKQLSSDFVPFSTPRLTRQVVITAGDSLHPFASASASQPLPSASCTMLQRSPIAITPTTSLSSPNGSGRSSRNSNRRDCADGFTTTNSSFIFLPVTNTSAGDSSSLRGISRSRRHNCNATQAMPSPILQTNHFTIEYEDDNNNNTSAGDDESINQQYRELGLVWANGGAHTAEMSNRSRTRIFNEEDAEALHLHDVGSILDDSSTSSRRNQHRS